MFWETLSAEAKHLVKVAALDALEQTVLLSGDEIAISGAFEAIFAALDRRTKLGPGPTLEWGQRYIAWARILAERDGLPFLMDHRARRMIELAAEVSRHDLAFSAVVAILHSYVPLERERAWWQKQRHRIAADLER